MKKRLSVILSLVLVSGVLLAGCSDSSEKRPPSDTTEKSSSESSSVSGVQNNDGSADKASAAETENTSSQSKTELVARFGYEGEPYILHLYENDTAAAIARHVGTSDWNLPIYHYDDYDNWEVMQYYDIPDRYEIPSAPEKVTEEKAGTVYYSEPNRVVLFYKDAKVPAEYTPVGYFDYTEEFLDAVEKNPVVEGWGNKIINISDKDGG